MNALSTSIFSSMPEIKGKSHVARYFFQTQTVSSILVNPDSESQTPTTQINNARLSKKTVSIRTYKTPQLPAPSNASLSSALLNALEDIINRFIDPPRCSSVDPRLVLSQNFAPVDELPPTECEIVEGVLPSCLDGAYIRNGPNPHFLPHGPYHLFDGDGMLHAIRISNGTATLCSRYVKTYKYRIEHEARTSIIPNFLCGCNGLLGFAARVTLAAAKIIAGQYNPSNGIGLANTSLALFGDRLYALGESDLPYEVRLTPSGDIQNKYVYAAVGDKMPKIKGVVKLDVSMAQDQQESVVASRMFGPGCNGGEPFFVASDLDNADEDDGYIVSFVHDENIGESKFVVMDAKSPTLDIVPSVKLPQRVPYGLHGLFVREKDLKKL